MTERRFKVRLPEPPKKKKRPHIRHTGVWTRDDGVVIPIANVIHVVPWDILRAFATMRRHAHKRRIPLRARWLVGRGAEVFVTGTEIDLRTESPFGHVEIQWARIDAMLKKHDMTDFG